MPTSQVERRKTEREGREVAISSVLSEVVDREWNQFYRQQKAWYSKLAWFCGPTV